MNNIKVKCGTNLDLETLDNTLEKFFDNYLDSIKTLKDFKIQFKAFAEEVFEINESTINNFVELLSKSEIWTLYEVGIPEIDEFLLSASEKDLEEMLSSDLSKNDEKETEDLSKEAAITDPEMVVEKSQDVNFITRAYGTSVGARSVMEEIMTEGLRRSIFFKGNSGFIQTNEEVNKELKNFQNKLFEDLKNYVRNEENSKDLDSRTLYNSHYVYNKGAFEDFLKTYANELKMIYPRLSFRINGQYTEEMTVGNLDNLYSLRSSNKRADRQLKAYNAYFLLLHFDDMVHKIYPAMEIRKSKWNKFETDGIDKYTLGSGAHVLQSWQDQEREIMPEELMSDVTKQLIADVDVYKFGTSELKNSKLEVASFNRIITKIKQWSNSSFAYTPINKLADDKSKALTRVIQAIYSPEELNGDITLYKILGNLNSNPSVNYLKLFKLLSTPEFWDRYAIVRQDKSILPYKLGLEASDIDAIWSIYLGMFKDSSEARLKEKPSLYERWKNDPDINNSKNYYNYIIQACATTESFKLQQYKEKDGVILNQTLSDGMINDEAELIIRNINSALSPTAYPYKEYEKKFLQKYKPGDSTENSLFETEKDPITSEEHQVFKFKVGKFLLSVDLKGTSNNITVTDNGEVVNLNNLSPEELQSFIPFFQDILSPLQIQDSFQEGILKEYVNLGGSKPVENLIKLTSSIFAMASAQQQIREKINDNPIDRVSNFINEALKYVPANDNEKVDINYSTEGGGFRTLINRSFFPVITNLAEAYKIIQGTHSDNIVTDSAGKMLSQIGVSMLITKTELQFATQNMTPTSASKHFGIHRGAFRGIQFAREFSGEESVLATKFNVNEHFLSMFLYDFIDNASKGTEVQSFPAPLSDKPRIPKIKSDLQTPSWVVDSEGKFKDYIDLTPEEWKEAISIELGAFYYNIWRTIEKLFGQLNVFLNRSPEYNGLQFSLGDNFKDLNSYIREKYEQSDKSDNLSTFAFDTLHDIILAYNKNNPNYPIELLDQLVILWDKKNKKFSVNELLISEMFRYSKEKDSRHVLQIFKEDFRQDDDFKKLYKEITGLNLEENKASNPFAGVFPQAGLQRYIINNHRTVDGENLLKLAIDIYNENNPSIRSKYIDENGNFNPEGTYEISFSDVVGLNWAQYASENFTSGEDFWKIKHSDLIHDILKNGVTIKTFDEDYNPVNSAILNRLKAGNPYSSKGENTWKSYGAEDLIAFARLAYRDDNGEIKYRMICKAADCRGMQYVKDGEIYKFDDLGFNFYDYITYGENKYISFELNPCLEIWNSCDFLIGQEFMNSTVGTHLNHPVKKNLHSKDVINEAERWLAQVKRNVSESATKYSFALNLLNGIRDTYRIAVIQDDIAPTFTIEGQYDEGGAKPFDGATYVCGTNNYLENNSLAGSAVGTNKKQFVHSYKPETGSGVIIKTAGFAITNAKIQQSDFFKLMNKKMMSGRWKTKNGQEFHPDLRFNYLQNNSGSKTYIQWEANGAFYYDESVNKYYQITQIVPKVEGVLDGNYTVKRKEVDIYGQDLKNADYDTTINSNYDLWTVFGGENSMSLTVQEDGSKILQDSESSFRNVVIAMNSISEDTFTYDNPPRSQKEVYQNLKYSNIDYVVTEGAIKLGAANINTRKAYFDPNYELTTMEVSMHDSGIQLDAEHHADESTLSIMTQVVNALCARGYTLDESSEAYQAMLALTKDGLSEYTDALKQLFNGNSEDILDVVGHTLLRGLKRVTGREGNLAAAVSEQLLQELSEGKYLKGSKISAIIPFSHPAMYKLLVSIISSALNKDSIKIKFPGSLAVLNPSNRIWKIFGDKLKADYRRDRSGLPTSEALIKAQQISDTKPLNHVSDIKLGHRYFLIKNGDPISNRESIYIESPYDYWKFKKQYAKKDPNLILVEDVMNGRDLATYQCHFTTSDDEHYNIWDLDVVKRFFYVDQLLEKDLNIVELAKTLDLDIKDKSEEEINKIVQLWFTFDNNFEHPKTKEEIQKGKINLEEINIFTKKGNALIKKLLQRDLLLNLHGLGKGLIGAIKVDGALKTIKGTPIVVPYELIMPKVFASRFGLKKGDSLSTILDTGAKFFRDRILSNWKTRVSSDDCFDLEFKNLTDGKQYYVISKNSSLYANMKLHFTLQVRPNFKWDGNKLWRMDDGGDERKYRMHSEQDEIWRDSKGNEIIVTDDTTFYVETLHYDSIRISQNLITSNEDLSKNYLNQLLAVNKSITNEYLNYLGIAEESDIDEFYEDSVKEFSQLAFEYSRMSEKDLDTIFSNPDSKQLALPILQQIDSNAARKFTSFKESLNILAARIPAQSMQSFMAMTVVGFDDAGVNDAYVNYWQIYLQGSDFDIDKVSLLGHSFTKNGLFLAWSNLFDLSSEEALHASLNLPFPTGKEAPISKKNWIKINDPDNAKLRVWKMLMSNKDSLISPHAPKIKTKLSPDEINIIAAILRTVNEQWDTDTDLLNVYVPEDASKEDLEIFKNFIKFANKHNTYLKRVDDKQPIITNFITTYMLKVSRNPINLIQGHSSVDYLTGMVKKIAEGAPSAKKTNSYAPGNVESKIETLILTLTGKENTGIVASAMKVYEALSYYFNHSTKEIIDLYLAGEIEKADRLAGSLVFKSLSVCGISPKLLSNTYSDFTFNETLNSILENQATGVGLEFIESLKNVDNDTDAFLLISALLSLATDNAKDPTLAKINAGPEMIGLYTAGIAMGVPFESLANTMMSNTGNMVNTLLNGNIFEHEKSKKFNDVERYLEEGPTLYSANAEVLSSLGFATQLYLNYTHIEDSDEEPSKKNYVKDIEHRLHVILKRDGNEGLLKVFKLALAGTKFSNGNIPEIKKLVTDAFKEFKNQSEGDIEKNISEGKTPTVENAEENANNNYIKELESLESLQLEDEKALSKIENELTKSKRIELLARRKRARRILETTLREWLDYSYALRTALSEYKTVSGGNVKVVNRKLDLRTAPYECHAVGQGYVENYGGVLKVNILTEYTPASDDEINSYKKAYSDWLNKYKEVGEIIKDIIPKGKLWEYFNRIKIYKHKKSGKQPSLAQSKKLPADIQAQIKELVESMPLYPEGEKVFTHEVNSDISGWETVYNPWSSMKTLSTINNEMGLLRDLLKLNQGLSTNAAEIINLQVKIEDILLNKLKSCGYSSFAVQEKDGSTTVYSRKEFESRIENLNTGYPSSTTGGQIDLYLFLTNNDYREEAIRLFEPMKLAFNVLKAVYDVPHYRGYLTAFNTQSKSMEFEFLAYRSSKILGNKVIKELSNITSKRKEEIYEAMFKFTTRKLNDLFLKQYKHKFILNSGATYFDVNLKELVSAFPVLLDLGTPHGNATFKLWFESTVIPNLKNHWNGQFRTDYNKNITSDKVICYTPKVIRDLITTEITRTITGNATSALTLPISTLPRSESEKRLYQKYKEDFNTLNSMCYYVTVVDPSTGKLTQVGYSLQELFFIYNIIVYGEESNKNSFTPIFEDLLRDGSLPVLTEFNEFYGKFDVGQTLKENSDYTLTELLQWCALKYVSMPYNIKDPYIQLYDYNTARYELYQYQAPPSITDENIALNEEEGYDYIPYVKVENSNLSSRMLPFTPAKVIYDEQILHFKDGFAATLLYNSIESVIYNGKTYSVSELKEMLKGRATAQEIEDLFNIPIITHELSGSEQLSVIDSTYINALIQEIFKPC